MKQTKKKNQTRARRGMRARIKIHGTAKRPRLSVYRSAKHISAQLINDDTGKTLTAISDKEVKAGKNKTETAAIVGTALAKKAAKAKIKTVVFDKGHCRYHGRIKALAEAARKEGLKF